MKKCSGVGQDDTRSESDESGPQSSRGFCGSGDGVGMISKRKMELRCAALQAEALGTISDTNVMGSYHLEQLTKTLDRGFDMVLQSPREPPSSKGVPDSLDTSDGSIRPKFERKGSHVSTLRKWASQRKQSPDSPKKAREAGSMKVEDISDFDMNEIELDAHAQRSESLLCFGENESDHTLSELSSFENRISKLNTY